MLTYVTFSLYVGENNTLDRGEATAVRPSGSSVLFQMV